jgi:hypothetical protein
MTDISVFTTMLTTPEPGKRGYLSNYFGNCPECGYVTDCLNVGGNHWFVCHAHRTKWCAGYNLFSGWRDEPKDIHRANAQILAGYHEVEPLPEAEPRGGEP